MSDESNPESPVEPRKPTSEHEPLEAAPVSDDAAAITEADTSTDADASTDAAPPSPASDEVGEDDFEITFYATIDTPQGEQIITPDVTHSKWPQDDVKILLPAWSETTVSSRQAVVRPPIQKRDTTRKRSLWRGCFLGAIAAVIIFSLLGSSLFSVFWFWNMRSDRVAEVTALLDAHSGLPQDQNPMTGGQDGQRDQLRAPALAAADAEPVNRIVFVNDNRQIETISPDGGDRRQLTSDAKSYLFPAWSQDGRFIAAIGSTINGGGIYVMPDEQETAAKEEVHFSTDDSPFYLYWSPDGQQITFLANDRSSGLSLNVLDLFGQESPSRVIAAGSPLYWNWTADSRRLLVHSGSGTSDSELLLIDDFGRPQAPRVPAPGPFQAPGISPNGRYWAYSQFQSGGNTWLVIDDRLSGADNSQRHAGAVAFNWSPTGDELAYISGEAEKPFSPWGPLRLMDAQTGDIRLLSSDTVLAFFWSPDGRKIATITVPKQNNLGRQFEVRYEKGRRLARLSSLNSTSPAAQIGPHTFGVNVIDVESGEGLQLLETGMSPIFLTQFLPYFDQYAFSHQIWSPDSNTLVLPLAEGRQSRLNLVDTRNGRTTPLADGSIGFWSRQ